MAHAERGELITPPATRFERVDVAHGFPQSSTNAIVERDDGYLWLTTLDGLVRFDGASHRVYDRTTDPGLLTTRMTALFDHAATGDLWIGTEDGRVIRKRGDRSSTLLEPRPSAGGVTGIHVSDDGGRLFVVRHAGVDEYRIVDDAGPTLEPGPQHPGLGSYACGTAVVGERELWRALDGEMVAVPLPAPLIDKDTVYCRGRDGGPIWLRGDASEVYRVERAHVFIDARSPKIPPDALPMHEDADGNLWLRFRAPPHLGRLDRAGDVHRYDERHGVDPLGDPATVHVDREGGLWIGTSIGVYRYLGEAIGGLHLRTDTHDTAIAAFFEASDGTMWLATRDARLVALRPDGEAVEFTTDDKAGRSVLRPELLLTHDGAPWPGRPRAPGAFSAFREDHAGRLWIGSDIGLLQHRPEDDRLVLHRARVGPGNEGEFDGAVNDVLVEGDGLWLATTLAVVRFEDDRPLRTYGAAAGIDSSVVSLLRATDGTLWAGTRAGVRRLVGERFEEVPGLGPVIGQARALHEDADHNLWVGPYDSGLLRRRPDGVVEHVGPAEAFPSGAFTLRFDGRGFLWT
ncbi:MAG TPA: hypothetical protein PKW35_17850, partial [Nannocystaceae bacterium]|nr:hypothetical protein [Nannocystaceae bacterium]